MTPDEIVADYPQLSLSQVYAAVSYYHDHRDEIWDRIREGERFAEELKAKGGPSVRELPRPSGK